MDVFEIVKGKIALFSELDLSLISKDTNLVENLEFDSFTLMCLIGELSEQYKIEINAEDVVSFTNVGDIVYYIEEKIKKKDI
ncbi:acyl carrier protein [Clostridium saccharoperbutylacetonicum]|uniref:acyl carrier protein n=1 Tax=Clostridium saccharoperbutylacetonicum TaxID=36745 RepID=UPI0039ED5AAC